MPAGPINVEEPELFLVQTSNVTFPTLPRDTMRRRDDPLVGDECSPAHGADLSPHQQPHLPRVLVPLSLGPANNLEPTIRLATI